ncbi:MAG: flavodoxin family protein [Spirochaetaceae bacterium]|jgi:multimeric flavodoxin WrbA|nr:flavodoxin family protein [Spirochaetaceae bacterium]
MKVIAFNGSPNKGGVCARGIKEVFGELSKEDIQTEVIDVGGLAIRGCLACGGCKGKNNHCVQKDDIVNECIDKSKEADGIIIASPVYYGSIAGTFKCFLDRFFFAGGKLSRKAGLAIASVRRTGGINTFHQLNNYLNLGGLIITPTVYWNVIHGNDAKEAEQDEEGLYTLRTAARNMAWLLKVLKAGASIALPTEEEPKRTNFIR